MFTYEFSVQGREYYIDVRDSHFTVSRNKENGDVVYRKEFFYSSKNEMITALSAYLAALNVTGCPAAIMDEEEIVNN